MISSKWLRLEGELIGWELDGIKGVYKVLPVTHGVGDFELTFKSKNVVIGQGKILAAIPETLKHFAESFDASEAESFEEFDFQK